jgi:RNA polymerase sigma-70 factor, ECF subfamily
VKEHRTVNARQGNIGVMAFRDHFTLWRTRPTTQVQPWTVEELASRYLDPLFMYVSRRITSNAEAEDIVAEVFMDVCRQLERIPKRNTNLESDATLAYLIGMARRKIALVLRKQEHRKEKSIGEDEEIHPALGESLDRQMLLQEQTKMLQKALNVLSEPQREILLLKYVDQRSLREISVIIGKSEGAANSLLQRARESARQAGSEYFEEKDLKERKGEERL